MSCHLCLHRALPLRLPHEMMSRTLQVAEDIADPMTMSKAIVDFARMWPRDWHPPALPSSQMTIFTHLGAQRGQKKVC